MRARWFGVIVLVTTLLSGLSASAQELAEIEIVPPHPTPADIVLARLSGTWGDSCVPKNPTVSRLGQEISINTSNPGQLCALILTPWALDVPIGQLPAGTYEVTARHFRPTGGPIVLGQAIFTVGEPLLCGDTSGPGGTDVPCHCGNVVTTNTRLNASDPVIRETCPADGLSVTGGVTLDLHGATIRGAGAGTGLRIADGASLERGTVIGFAIGIASDGSTVGTLISQVSVLHSVLDGIRLKGDGNTVEKAVVQASGDDGISVRGDGNELVRNRCSRNGRTGLVVQGRENLLDHNSCELNGGDGIFVAGDTNTLVRNAGGRNGGTGVSVGGNENSLTHNQAPRNAGDGIRGMGTMLESDRRNYGARNGGANCEIDGFTTLAGTYC